MFEGLAMEEAALIVSIVVAVAVVLEFGYTVWRTSKDRADSATAAAAADEKAARALQIAEEAKAAVQVRAALASEQRDELRVQILSRQLAGLSKYLGSACETLQNKSRKVQDYVRISALPGDSTALFRHWQHLSVLHKKADDTLTALETGTLSIDMVKPLYDDLMADVFDVPELGETPDLHAAPSASTSSNASPPPPPVAPPAAAEAP